MGDSGVGDFRVGDCAPPPQKAAAKKKSQTYLFNIFDFFKKYALNKNKRQSYVSKNSI